MDFWKRIIPEMEQRPFCDSILLTPKMREAIPISRQEKICENWK